jgi:predicted glycoside hydrolase/deacetylase ChbG (UPF0249 family)
MEIELRTQYSRYHDMLGRPPALVNAHHHVQVFSPIGNILRRILREASPLPFLRCVREPWSTLTGIPGARAKRTFLSLFGRRQALRQRSLGFPGSDWLAGITDPPWVTDSAFLLRWVTKMPGTVVELTCHPGYLDMTLIGRDCTPDDGHLQRRVHELHLLRQPSFREACQRARFILVAPSQLTQLLHPVAAHAA